MKLSKLNTSIHHALRCLLSCLLASCYVACEGGDDTVVVGQVITPGGAIMDPAGMDPAGDDSSGTEPSGMDDPAGMPSGMDNPAGMPGGMDPAGTPGGGPAGTEPPPCVDTIVDPDEEVFASSVGPSLIQTCANTFCHEPGTNNGLVLPVGSFDFAPPLAGDLLTESIAASMEYVIPGDPNSSALLRKAYNAHISNGPFFSPNTPEYDQLYDWIDAMITCVPIDPPPPVGGMEIGGMEIGGMDPAGMPAGMPAGDPAGMPAGTPGGGNTDVLCDLLPNGDPQNRANGEYYNRFANEVNNSLTVSCGSSGCHGTPMNGFWLQPNTDTCAIPANFLMIQAYINFANVDSSPILTAPYDPEHSGYQIYTGRSDPRFVALRNWVLLAFQ